MSSVECQDDEPPGAGDLVDQHVEVGFGGDVTRRRIVEKQDVGVGDERAGHHRFLLVAAGQSRMSEARRSASRPQSPPGSRAAVRALRSRDRDQSPNRLAMSADIDVRHTPQWKPPSR